MKTLIPRVGKMICAAMLWLPMVGSAQTYVVASRLDLGMAVPSATLPLSTFTNCVFWMDANAGVYNAGATNFFVPDFSTNRNDATQTSTNYQPALVFTNGHYGLSFDGIDDCVFSSITPTGTVESATVRFFLTNAVTYESSRIILFSTAQNVNDMVALGSSTGVKPNEIIMIDANNGVGRSYWLSSTNSIPAGWNTLSYSWDVATTRYAMYLNGERVDNDGSGSTKQPLAVVGVAKISAGLFGKCTINSLSIQGSP